MCQVGGDAVLTEAQICLRVDVQDALAQLEFEERTVLWLAGVCGWSMGEVGEMFGWSDDRCQRMWKRARAVLRDHLWMYRGLGRKTHGKGPNRESNSRNRGERASSCDCIYGSSRSGRR